MTVSRIGPVECEYIEDHFPWACLIFPRHLNGANVAIMESGLPVIVGTEAIYGPEHITCFDLEIDYRRTLKAITETK